MKKHLRLAILIFVALFCVFAGPADAHAESVPNHEDYTRCGIYVNGSKVSASAASRYGNLYVDIDTLQKYGSVSGWKFDTDAKVIKIKVSDLNVVFADAETTAFIKKNAGTVEIPLKYFHTDFDKTDKYYVSLGSVAQLARITWKYSGGNVYLTTEKYYSGKFGTTDGTKTVISTLSDGGSLSGFYENETVSVVKETTSFYQVKDPQGKLFYINKADLQIKNTAAEIPNFCTTTKTKTTWDRPVSLMWSRTAECPEPIDGLDCFVNITLNQKASSDGSCINTTDYGFIQTAHANGFKVWICAQNGFSTDASDYIDSNLANKSAANRTIAQYLFYCAIYNADGISLDYEAMSTSSSRDNFIYFVQTLCKYGHKLGLTVSVATYYGTPYNNSHLYPFDIFGECCDYLLEMTYGEDFDASLSNMSQKWWREGTDYIASKCPPEKVILGVAYHMRYTVWNSKNVMMRSSKPSMRTIMKDLMTQNISYAWDETTGQYYAEEAGTYEENGVIKTGTARYYLEEQRSGALKAQYIVDNHLGGTIGWEYDYLFEPNDKFGDVFQAFYGIYEGGKTYADFVPETEPVGPAPPDMRTLTIP